ncbi:MAG: hypothetical protein V4519_03765 [Patescibacteria group bacterium]
MDQLLLRLRENLTWQQRTLLLFRMVDLTIIPNDNYFVGYPFEQVSVDTALVVSEQIATLETCIKLTLSQIHKVQNVAERMHGADINIGPKREMMGMEVEVGVMSPNLRRLYRVYRGVCNRLNTLNEQLDSRGHLGSRKMDLMHQLVEEEPFLHELLMQSIAHEFPTVNGLLRAAGPWSKVCFRKGWKLVIGWQKTVPIVVIVL